MAGLTQTRNWWSIVFSWRRIRVKEALHTQSREEAERRRKKLERAIRDGTFDYLNFFPNPNLRNLTRLGLVVETGKPITLAVFAETWLASKGRLKPRTLLWYRDTLKNHILPHPIAGKNLVDITRTDCEQFITDVDKVTGPRAVNAARARLHSIFERAIDDRILERNPIARVDTVQEKRSKPDPFELDEIKSVVDAAGGTSTADGVLITVLVFSGMRPGEALALRWDDVDWRRGVIGVARTVDRSGVHSPKTAGSGRDVAMLDVVRDALQAQRSRSQLRSRNGLIFPSERDTPLGLDNFRDHNWKRILRAAKVKYRTIYQCRHTFATTMLRYESTQWVAAQLGHTTIDMVVRHYARWLRAPESRAVGRANADISETLRGATERMAERSS